MADAEKLVPGTWFLTVTVPGFGVTQTIITFTSDGGMVERAEPMLEAAIGVWELGDEEKQFRFMFYRFQQNLTVTEPKEEQIGENEEQEVVKESFNRILRVRSTNRLTSQETFTGTGTGDFLSADGTPTGPPAFHTTATAVRLKLVPE